VNQPGRIANIASLTFVTYLFGGYQFGTWPQLFPLEHIEHLAGRLPGDWYTSHAAPHWCFDHVAALIPDAWLSTAFAIGWVLATGLFWWGFAQLAADLGAPELAIFGAGVIGARTFFAGFGATSLLTPYFYPSQIAIAVWMLGLRTGLRGRAWPAGALAGVTMLVHPQVGLLATLSLGVVLLCTAPRRIPAFAVTALLVGGFALVRLIRDLGLAQPIAASQRFAVLALVRLPHHLVYGMFPRSEFVAVLAWLAVLVIALGAARGGWRRAAWWAFVALGAALCAAGAWASWRGAPLALVEIQTARMSAWVPLLAVIAAAASLSARGAVGTLALLATPILGEALWVGIRGAMSGLGIDGIPGTTAQAPILAALIPLAALAPRFVARGIERRQAAARGDETHRNRPWWPWVATPLLVAAGFLVSGWRRVPVHRMDPAWVEIARAARDRSRPGELFLTPPDLDGFRFYSRRPIVCDFGNIAHDDLRGWVERMIAVTGDSTVMAPVPRLEVPIRSAHIAAAYDRNLPSAATTIRRYGVAFVVARATPGLAAEWAIPVVSNSKYVVYRIRREKLH
jgi:hypothetical protein